MLPHGRSSGYRLSDKKQQAYHTCSIQLHNILKTIDSFIPVRASVSVHSIQDTDIKAIEQLFSAYHSLG